MASQKAFEDGFLNLRKPAGPTSHRVVQLIRRWSGGGRVGHGGTLDPEAEGVLPIGLGYGTRLLEFIPEPKVYRAQVVFGAETDTYDATGEVVVRHDIHGLDKTALEHASRQFLGEIQQRPPRYSALKRQGQPLYRLARQGVVVEVAPRAVRVYRLELRQWAAPVATIEVECGRGTYIRSLAHDLGQVLGCGAYLQSLVRTQVGGFTLEESLSLDELERAFEEGQGQSLILPLDFPVRHWPAVHLSSEQVESVLQGKDLVLTCTVAQGETAGETGGSEGGRRRAYGPSGELVALLEQGPEATMWHPFKVFPPRK